MVVGRGDEVARRERTAATEEIRCETRRNEGQAPLNLLWHDRAVEGSSAAVPRQRATGRASVDAVPGTGERSKTRRGGPRDSTEREEKGNNETD